MHDGLQAARYCNDNVNRAGRVLRRSWADYQRITLNGEERKREETEEDILDECGNEALGGVTSLAVHSNAMPVCYSCLLSVGVLLVMTHVSVAGETNLRKCCSACF